MATTIRIEHEGFDHVGCCIGPTRRPRWVLVGPGGVSARVLSVELFVGPIEIELDAEQHDAVVGNELPDDYGCGDEKSPG